MKSTDTSKATTPVQPENGDDKQPEVAGATEENAKAGQEDENTSARVTKKTSTASIHSHNLPYAMNILIPTRMTKLRKIRHPSKILVQQQIKRPKLRWPNNRVDKTADVKFHAHV
ncbi:hypothetical protein KDW_36370 [Dictyobacter vulcani]|uniref:Uncharacterized protein n=1 Tax=Dictyobacter vulcani TaxID=2607529 RepID=A0A5J4KNP4_9CHLR|nr:hypothetical protein [Dictyobacter vulcani]GER89475.1 hypothetical protein KDW_36370 [Dictyobacter vulcani]